MADGMTAEVHGLEEAIHAVDEIHPRITKYVVGKSLTIGARVFVNGMRGLVPARWPKLKKSIKLKRLRANKSGRSYLIGPSWPDGALINLV